jgi:hypothetical protein
VSLTALTGTDFGPGMMPALLQGLQIGSGSIGSPGFISAMYPEALQCGTSCCSPESRPELGRSESLFRWIDAATHFRPPDNFEAFCGLFIGFAHFRRFSVARRFTPAGFALSNPHFRNLLQQLFFSGGV